MNQEEKLVSQSKWSGKRVVLLYWFSIAFLGTAAAAGLGAGVLNPKYSFDAVQMDHSSITDPWGPQDCTGAYCHNDSVDTWNETGHAHAAVPFTNTTGDFVEIAGSRNVTRAQFDSSCGHCMATGWDNSTGTVIYWDFGVTCAACHEPGVINYTAASCGNCHTGSHHPQYPDYQKSAHSQSMDDLLASDHAGDHCLHCMSGQGLYAEEELSLDDTFLTSINCATCHDPHDATNSTQLREADVTDLCGECHSGGRHGSLDMLTDTETTSAHRYIDCTSCHGYQLDSYGEAGVNHTWAVTTDGCSTCHSNPTERWTLMEDIQGDITALMDEYETLYENVTKKVDEANETAGVDEALINDSFDLIAEAEALFIAVDGDGSEGFHNPDLAEAKLKLALTKLDEAYAKAEEAVAGGGDVPGFEVFTVLAAISVLAVGVLLYKKRR
ncbi:MAG: ammonia-forming cytochrome c nitrite reductase subunit c552 [Candidatus Hermodarchaeota archaeon]